MTSLLCIILVCVSWLPTPCISTPTPLPPASSPTSQQFSQAHFQFTLDLYLALVRAGAEDGDKGGGGNLIFSPVGVASVLSPLLSSSSQSVSRQIRQVLRYSNMSVEDVEAEHTAMMSHFLDPYYQRHLRLSSSLYLQQSFSQSPLLDLYPPSSIYEVDFEGNLTGVKQGIQSWVEEVSEGKIAPPTLDAAPAAPLALLVMFFSGGWLNGFHPNRTFDQGLFYNSSQHRFEIPMMVGRLEVPLGYSAQLEVRVLELPLSDRRASLFILLPDRPDNGLANFEQNITAENIKTLLSTLKDERVNIRLPRFQVKGIPPLKEALNSLGLTSLFTPHSILPEFIHSAACEVVEGETPPPDSSGGPGVAGGTFGDKYFEVDHPFIFFVWDYLGSSIVVMGRVVSPLPIILPN